MHLSRGWRQRPCPTCHALSGEPCHTPSNRQASRPHSARLYAGRRELATRQAVWEELQRRGAVLAEVPFSGRGGAGGRTGTIILNRQEGDEIVDVERWSGRDELALALEGPVWDRYGHFTGHPQIRGTVTWLVTDRLIVIAGYRGDEASEERLT